MFNLNKFNIVKKQYGDFKLPGIPQKDFELNSFCMLMENLKPQVFVEIGTRNAGSTWMLSHYMPIGSTIVSIDLPSSDNNKQNKSLVLNKIKENGYDVHSLELDSTSPATIEKLKEILADRPIDCLFIDGDHMWNGVVKDWENYNPLVRSGGVVAFHDIVKNKERPWEVHMLWRVLRTVFKFEEFKIPNTNMGIGIIYKS